MSVHVQVASTAEASCIHELSPPHGIHISTAHDSSHSRGLVSSHLLMAFTLAQRTTVLSPEVSRALTLLTCLHSLIPRAFIPVWASGCWLIAVTITSSLMGGFGLSQERVEDNRKSTCVKFGVTPVGIVTNTLCNLICTHFLYTSSRSR